jgi:hypothetical protein
MAGRLVQVLTMNNFKWYDFLRSCPRLFAGTHTELKGVTTLRCASRSLLPTPVQPLSANPLEAALTVSAKNLDDLGQNLDRTSVKSMESCKSQDRHAGRVDDCLP